MLLASLLAVTIAAMPPPPAASSAAPSASPGAAATPRALKTIITVISSPYCNALAQHFNAALVPMLANDQVFDRVGVQLDDMNEMFNYPDYANRFLDLRTKVIKESGTLVESLMPIQQQIDQLRESASLSSDPTAAQQMRDAASQLQQAYKHQFQLSTDLSSLARSMMEYDITRGPHPLGGWTPELQRMPADEKNIRVYLRFDGQRDLINNAENHAVDGAYAIAQTRCTK
jgi:hypothetical protein